MAKKSTSRKSAPVREDRGVSAKTIATSTDVAEIVRRSVITAANDDLRAYAVDRNPLHILRAVQRIADTGEPLPPVIRRWLARAIKELSRPVKKEGKPSPRNTDRDLRVVRRLTAMHKGELPKQVPDASITSAANAEGLTPAAVRMIVSRYRQRLGKPSRRDNRR